MEEEKEKEAAEAETRLQIFQQEARRSSETRATSTSS